MASPATPADGPPRTALEQPGVTVTPSAGAVLSGTGALLRSKGHAAEAAMILDRMREAQRRPSTIVVVGELSRGKSSLVNALLGVPDLSPVGYDETTGAYLGFMPPSDDFHPGSARLEFVDGRTRELPADEVAGWITVEGKSLAAADEDLPLGAWIAAESPLLPGAVLVDTPGAGGLNESHARLAISRAEKASILLLVTDAGAALTTHALNFLGTCAEHVEAIVVVINKIDRAPGWRSRIAENREALVRKHPRFANIPILGISAADALRAVTADDPRTAERYRSASNLAELVSTLSGLLDRADRLPVVNAIRHGQSLLAPIAAKLAADQLTAFGGEDAARAFEEKQRRFEQLQEHRSAFRFDWDGAMSSLRREFEAEIEARVEEFADTWQARIGGRRWGLGNRELQSLSVDMVAELAVIESDLRQLISERFTATIATLYEEVGLVPDPELWLDTPESERRQLPVGRVPDRPSDLDVGLALQGFVGYNLAAGIAGVAAPVIVPLLGGAALVGLGLLGRNSQKRKTNLSQFVKELQSRLIRSLTREYGAGFDRLRSRVMKDFDRQLTRGIAETREQAAAARRMMKESEQKRADLLAQLRHDLAEVQRLEAAGNEEIRRLLE